MTTALDDHADFARALADEAGALASRYFRRELAYTCEAKGPQDWVSEADREVEALVRARLRSAYPDDAVFGEEAGGAMGARTWLVDPIDGTLNFVHGVRYWCVSIALVEHGIPMVGVIADPANGETYWAMRGRGAWCNERRIAVSGCSDVEQALVTAGFVARHTLGRYHALHGALVAAGAAVKDMGAGALMLAHVAAGRYDGYIEPHMYPWDATAGLLLVQEAGGRTRPYPGRDGWAAGGAVLASAPALYARLDAIAASA